MEFPFFLGIKIGIDRKYFDCDFARIAFRTLSSLIV